MMNSRVVSLVSSSERLLALRRASHRCNRFGRSKTSVRFISSSDLIVNLKTDRSHFENRPKKEDLVFGHTFTDHMLTIEWDTKSGWGKPKISPYQNLQISPAASSLHYGERTETSVIRFRHASQLDSIAFHLARKDSTRFFENHAYYISRVGMLRRDESVSFFGGRRFYQSFPSRQKHGSE